MKLRMKCALLVTSLLIGLLCSSCASHNTDAAHTPATAAPARISDAGLANVAARISALKSKFDTYPDSVTHIVWYAPKWDSTGGAHAFFQPRVVMYVTEQGDYHFISIFVGTEYINHDQLQFVINDTTYATARIDSIYLHLKKTDFMEDYYMEQLVFDKTNDGGIPEKIYHSHGSVSAAFFADQKHMCTVLLSDKVIQQIKDGYELSMLLKLYAAQMALKTKQ